MTNNVRLERPPQGTSEAALWRHIIKIFHVAIGLSAASLGPEKYNGTLGPRRLMHAVELEATTRYMLLACKRQPYYSNIEHEASREFKMMRNGAIGCSRVLVQVLHPS
jgi:hypothetical protein